MTASFDSSDHVVQKLRDAMVELTPKQFDQLIVFLLRELDERVTVEFVPVDTTSAVDLEVTLTHPLVSVEYGIALEHTAPTTHVSDQVVQDVVATLDDRGLQTGTVITTGEFADDARKVAENHGLTLVDGHQLASLLVENELGFMDTSDGIVLDQAFWELFRGQTRTDTIPSIEIPQADSIERLTQVLTVVDAGNHKKSAIAHAVESLSGDSFDPRQADYYGTAGWLLGFLHKDLASKDTKGRGRWGITRLGRTYLSHRQNGDDEKAEAILYEQIRNMEVIRRILQQLQDEGSMRREEITDLVRQETEVSGTTGSRRTLTLVKWLQRLPEIDASGRGSSQQIRYRTDAETEPVTVDCTSVGGIEPESAENISGSPPDEDSILDDIVSSFDMPSTVE